MIIIATIIKPFSFRSARVPVNTAFEYVLIHVFMPHSTHASLFLFLFSRASSVTGSNPRSHHVFVRSSTFALLELFSFGQDPAFMARAWLMSSNQQPFRHPPTMTLYEALTSQSQSRRSCTANRWFWLLCSQQISGFDLSSNAIGSTILFHSLHAAIVLSWRVSVVAFNDDNPLSFQSSNIT